MSLKAIACLGFLLTTQMAWSCDVCSFYRFYYPGEQSTFVSLKHRMRFASGKALEDNSPSFFRHLEHINVDKSDQVDEYFGAIDVNGQISLKKNWFLEGQATFHSRQRMVNGDRRVAVHSLGDLRLGIGRALAQGDVEAGKWNYVSNASIGVKLPTGQTDIYYNHEPVDYDMQPGTGSIDIYTVIKQSLIYNQSGLTSIIIAQANTPNLSGYRFGHTVSGSLAAFRKFEAGTVEFFPSAGLACELQGSDMKKGKEVNASAANRLFAQIGITTRWEAWQFQATWQPTLDQTVNPAQLPVQFLSSVGVSRNF